VYTKEPYDAVSGSGPNGWDGLAKNWNKPSMMATGSENVQRMVYRAVHEWRDRVAREADESTQYVIPNRYLFKIAEAPPQDVVVLLRMVGDQQYQQPQQPQQQQQQQQQQQVSDVVKRRGKELIKVMKHVVKMSDKDKSDVLFLQYQRRRRRRQTANSSVLFLSLFLQLMI